MASNGMPTSSSEGLLLNAEPFGFGPTAAIADFFPHLRRMFGRVGYIGASHTLDLQTRLPYDTVYGITDTQDALVSQALRELRTHYSVFFTALDFAMAEKALNAGFRVVIYDPLTWYWRELPPVANHCLYIAQDFFGVRERIAKAGVRNPRVVAPIVDAPGALQASEAGDAPDAPDARTRQLAIASLQDAPSRGHVLLNLGGLSNPTWSADDALAYARLIVEGFAASMKARGETNFVIATNAGLAREFAHLNARNYTRDEMQRVLRTARYALMTPGLGNIYDAARFNTPSIWLPPANDSQGQQRDLLRQNDILDAAIDWSDLLPGTNIDYRAEQEQVLFLIAEAVANTSRNDDARARLTALMARLSDEVSSTSTGKCSALLQQFGSGGALEVANLVLRFAKERNHAHL